MYKLANLLNVSCFFLDTLPEIADGIEVLPATYRERRVMRRKIATDMLNLYTMCSGFDTMEARA
jgi:hypothetical protein